MLVYYLQANKNSGREDNMDNLDLVVLRTLCAWRTAGRRAVLTTIVRTWGSSPRPVGSIMALCEDGSVVGSVSGGCIEDDLIDRYTQRYTQTRSTQTPGTQTPGNRLMPGGAPQMFKYGIQADDAHRFGLPCGGTLELLLEFNPDPSALADLVTQLDAGRLVRRQVCRRTGRVTLTAAKAPDALHFDAHALINTLGPGYRMLLIGAGALTDYLSTMALFNGFAVTVCDPRLHGEGFGSLSGVTTGQSASLGSAGLFATATDMPDDAVIAFAPDARSCVIALTHDPKLDDLALLEALHSPAFYVGAIGSRRNNALRRQRMIEHLGETEETLCALRGPIGIYIGSKTPAEIAVSIMAEVLAVKNGVRLPRSVDVGQAKTLKEI